MASFFRKATQYQMFVNVRSQIESRFIKVPVWYEPVCIQPPPPPYRLRTKVPNIELPDLSVRDEILERYPELNTPVRVHNFATDYVPIVDRWVTKHRELVAKGMPVDKVWNVMEKEYADYRYRRLVERLTTLEEVRRASGGTVHDELPTDMSNTDEKYEERIDLVDEQLDRNEQLDKYEALRAELEERQEQGNYALLTADELSSEQFDLKHSEQLEFVKLNPTMRRYFDEHLEMINMHGIDVEHEIFKNIDLTDEDSVDRAVERYAQTEFKLKTRVWNEPMHETTLGQVMNDVIDAHNPYEIEAGMLQKLALESDEPSLATPEAIEAFKARYAAASSHEKKMIFAELLRLTAETADVIEFGDIQRQTMPDLFNDKLQAELGVDIDAMSEADLAKSIEKRLTPTEDDTLIARVRKLTATQNEPRRPKKSIARDDD